MLVSSKAMGRDIEGHVHVKVTHRVGCSVQGRDLASWEWNRAVEEDTGPPVVVRGGGQGLRVAASVSGGGGGWGALLRPR